MELNCVMMIGRLGRDPEGRDAGSSRVAKFSICSNRRYKVNGEQREDACWIDVKAWGKLAELCERFLKKGSEVMVSGYLSEEQWEKEKDGQKRSKHVLVADKVSFGARADGEEKPASRKRSDDYSYAAPPIAPSAEPASSGGDDEVEDDLPF